jgi:hypothetical protein
LPPQHLFQLQQPEADLSGHLLAVTPGRQLRQTNGSSSSSSGSSSGSSSAHVEWNTTVPGLVLKPYDQNNPGSIAGLNDAAFDHVIPAT